MVTEWVWWFYLCKTKQKETCLTSSGLDKSVSSRIFYFACIIPVNYVKKLNYLKCKIQFTTFNRILRGFKYDKKLANWNRNLGILVNIKKLDISKKYYNLPHFKMVNYKGTITISQMANWTSVWPSSKREGLNEKIILKSSTLYVCYE